MIYSVSYDPVALSEYDSAIVYYSMHSISVAENFIAEFSGNIQLIFIHPESYKVTYKNHRESSLRKFPTLLFTR